MFHSIFDLFFNMESHYGQRVLKFCFTLNIDTPEPKSNGSMCVTNMNMFQEICSTNHLFRCPKFLDFHAKEYVNGNQLQIFGN
jgi:hypothetical protein